jgi:hypothetical protein
MTAFTTITNALVAVGAKPFATTVQALRDNPVAIAEGDATAPRVYGKALGFTFIGYQSSPGTTFADFTNLDRMQTIKLDVLKGDGYGANQRLQMRFSSDNGSTWGSTQDIWAASTFPGAEVGQGAIYLNLVSGVISGWLAGNTTTQNISTTLTVPSNCNAFSIRYNASGGTTRALAFCLGGIE